MDGFRNAVALWVNIYDILWLVNSNLMMSLCMNNAVYEDFLHWLCYVNFSKEMDEFRSAIALWVNIYFLVGQFKSYDVIMDAQCSIWTYNFWIYLLTRIVDIPVLLQVAWHWYVL
jgi:hypothetical protein